MKAKSAGSWVPQGGARARTLRAERGGLAVGQLPGETTDPEAQPGRVNKPEAKCIPNPVA